MKKVVIVGLGSAGLSSASHLSFYSKDFEVIVFEKNGDRIFHPCSVPAALAGEYRIDKLVSPSPRMRGVKIIKNEVLNIDVYKQKVYTKDGEEFFDYLIISTGGRFKTYPNEKVFTINGYEDVISIENKITTSKNVLIIGAGVLGMELASALSVRKFEIEILEMRDRILWGFLDEKLSEKFLDIVSSNKNIRFNFGIVADLSNINSDFAISCVGFNPVVPNFIDLNISNSTGIPVDETMRVITSTSNGRLENVFAAGDCVSPPKKLAYFPRLATTADVQGKVIAENILGKTSTYSFEVVPPCILKSFGYCIGKVGLSSEDAKSLSIESKSFYFELPSDIITGEKVFISIVLSEEGKILGLQGLTRSAGEMRNLLNITWMIMKLSLLPEFIAKAEFCYQPEICNFPDNIKSIFDFVKRRLNLKQ